MPSHAQFRWRCCAEECKPGKAAYTHADRTCQACAHARCDMCTIKHYFGLWVKIGTLKQMAGEKPVVKPPKRREAAEEGGETQAQG